ncbi:peptidase S9 prolyl oligopeptidase active site domain protein [Natrinema pallidum DSM 3751]|uniref:Peptidase S9 prolyl oligopeptidase active site domain protein n=1 Tax=Natrinema pallidum DSM 3751 TaxID=1227495 RepID=L9YKG7_9EURY|nr:peptidase S9 prolyl oligopeptidase active site domain protein [Natrinema pallidum DSM 3751]
MSSDNSMVGQLRELVALPELYQATVSPDGTKVAFYWDKSGRNELYIYMISKLITAVKLRMEKYLEMQCGI